MFHFEAAGSYLPKTSGPLPTTSYPNLHSTFLQGTKKKWYAYSKVNQHSLRKKSVAYSSVFQTFAGWHYDCDDKVMAVTEWELGGRINAGALK